ncbi:O-antigen ligase family protein [Paenarthrobacter nicotinovorans]|uniref:O-antigen ligase family protein n=1 Tax=Paenarthrobacter nicotinovorans TaxID=29320 RepID=UPI0037F20C32
MTRVALALVAATPLMMLPDGLHRFVLPKVAILSLVVAAGVLVPATGRLRRPVVLIMSAIVATYVISALNSGDFVAALIGRWPRYEGLPVLLLYVGLLVVGSRVLGGTSASKSRGHLLTALCFCMLVLAPVAVAEAAGLRPLGGAGNIRPGATMGNATDLGLVGLVACLLLLPVSLWTKNRLVQAGAVAAGVVTVASGSRACMLVLLIAGIVVIGFKAFQLARSQKPVYAIAVLGGFLGTAAVLSWSIPSVAERLFSLETVTGRVYLWAASLQALSGNAVLGLGAGQFVDVLPSYLSDAFAENVGTEFPADSPHMILLQLLSAGGLFFLLSVSALVCLVIVLGIRRVRTASTKEHKLFLTGALTATCAYGAALMTHFTSPGTTGLVCMLAGAILGGTPGQERTWPIRTGMVLNSVRLSAVGLGVVAAIFAAVAAGAELHMKAGADLAAKGNTTQASKEFDQAKALRPWDQDIDLLAAQSFAVRAVQGDGPAAGAAFTWASAAVERNPRSLEALTALAIGQLGTGDVAAAGKTLDDEIDRSPWTSEPYLLRGILKANEQDLAGAIADTERAAALTPKPERALSMLSELYVMAGQPDKAAEVESRLAKMR